MANDLNMCQFIGRIGQDPEIKYLPSGGAVANFSIACGESWTDKNTNEKKEKTEWVRVSVFGKLAEVVVAQYCQKGTQIYVQGKLQTRKWQDQQGQDRYTTEIVVQGFGGTIQLLGGRNDNQGQGQQQPQQQQWGGQQQMAPQQQPQQQMAPQQQPQQQMAPQQMAPPGMPQQMQQGMQQMAPQGAQQPPK